MPADKLKILFASRHCYLDDSNGAAVSSRELLQLLANNGMDVEVFSSITLDLSVDVNPTKHFSDKGWKILALPATTLEVSASGVHSPNPTHLRLTANGVPVTLHCNRTTQRHTLENEERKEFLCLFDIVMRRFAPDIVLGYGGDETQGQIFARSRHFGASTLFSLHNCRYSSSSAFDNVDKVRVPSTFAADYYRNSLGLQCEIIPNPIDHERINAYDNTRKYVTFVNPTNEKGLLVFARIAYELGSRRPDIPFLVVESLGNEQDVAGCGLDLRTHNNVYFMRHTHNPKNFYKVSRLVIIPSLVNESFGRIAAEAMSNGIPVVASDRGALPETVGSGGVVLRIPQHLTSETRSIPSTEDIQPWIDTIIDHWDNELKYARLSEQAKREASRWRPDVLTPQFLKLANSLIKYPT